MKKSSLYTRTGDSGETSLFGGKRVSKSSPRIEALGCVDELNAALGVALSNCSFATKKILLEIQNDLFTIGAALANSKQTLKLTKRVGELEKLIDQTDQALPELHNFILPSGTKGASSLHWARSVCRKAERQLVKLSLEEKLEPTIGHYFNRVSDLLFALARAENDQGKNDIIWKPK